MSVSHTDDEAFRKKYQEEHAPCWEWFAWLRTFNGELTMQAWGRDYQTTTMTGINKHEVLQKHKLGMDDQWLNLDQLAKKYPYAQG